MVGELAVWEEIGSCGIDEIDSRSCNRGDGLWIGDLSQAEEGGWAASMKACLRGLSHAR